MANSKAYRKNVSPFKVLAVDRGSFFAKAFRESVRRTVICGFGI
jgi:hypothetical protein